MEAEGIQRPFIFLLVMAKDVSVRVVGQNFETTVPYAIPLIENLHHFKGLGISLSVAKTERAFVSFVAGITFDMKCHWHRWPAVLDGQFVADGLSKPIGIGNRFDGNSRLNQNIL
jgi:hypothetical protein